MINWIDKVDGINPVSAKDVNDLAQGIKDIEANPAMHPYIGSNSNWYVFNVLQQKYVDTGIKAKSDTALIQTELQAELTARQAVSR